VLGGAVLWSAIGDVRNLRREFGRTRTLTIHGRRITVDGATAHVERGWLGPGLTIVWLRTDNRREMLSLFRAELCGADHAALRRHLRELDLRQ